MSEVQNKGNKDKVQARGCWFYVKRVLLILVIVIVGLPLSGMVYEQIMSQGDAERFPAPGQFYEVQGHKMHLYCLGEGSPTVVLEAGFGSWSQHWYQVQPEIGKFTRTCAYDRAGLGWSESASTPRTQEQIAIDLHDLLTVAKIEPPYVLVGHSMAGKSIRLFTSLYPDDVAGMVFVDARHENQEPTNRTAEQNAADGEAYRASFGLHRSLRDFGVARLLGVQLGKMVNPAMQSLADDRVYHFVMFAIRESAIHAQIDESQESMSNDIDLGSAYVPDDLPIVVLTASDSLYGEQAQQSVPNWHLGQESLAALSSNSIHKIVEDSTHNIQFDQPQAVVDAVKQVVDAGLSGTALSQ